MKSFPRAHEGMSRFPIPGVLGRYALAERLAVGGYGTVALARAMGPLGFSRWAAVKIAHEHVAGEPHAQRLFLHEVQIASCLVHANICSPFDSGVTEDGVCYLAMDFLRGRSFTELQRLMWQGRGRLGATGALFVAQIIADAARGLHAAHELSLPGSGPANVVHRDVAPSNLMLCFDGVVKALDFGIAKSVHQDLETRAGLFRGHAAYSSPEQFSAQPIDRRADVFGLGVVLWELLAGKPCFDRSSALATMRDVVEVGARPLESVAPWVPRELAAIADTALASKPEHRFQTAASLAEALERHLLAAGQLLPPSALSRLFARIDPQGASETEQRLQAAAQRLDALVVPTPGGRLTSEPSAPTVIAPAPVGRITTPLAMEATAPRSVTLVAPPRSPRRLSWGLGGLAALVTGAAIFWVVSTQAPAPRAATAPEPAPPAAPAETAPALALPAARPESLPGAGVEASTPRVERPAPVRDDRRGRRNVATASQVRLTDQGTVAISTVGGWAEVIIDDAHLGETPVVTTLPPGPHDLVLRFPSSKTLRRTLEVMPSANIRLSFEAP